MEFFDLKYLQYAMTVAKYGSVTRAAQELYLAQPNMSRAIRELEETLGFSLFQRSKRGMTLTPQGKRFLEEAETMIERLSNLAKEFSKEKARHFHFSCVPSSLFVNTILEAARRLPEQTIQCQEYYKCTELFDTVEKGRSSAAFLTFGTEMKDTLLSYLSKKKLEYHFLGQSPAYGVVRRTSPLYIPGNPPKIDYSNGKLMLNISYFEPIGISFHQKLRSLPPAAGFCYGLGRAANLDRLEAQDDLVMLSCHIHSKIMSRNDLVAIPLSLKQMAYEYGYVTRKGSPPESQEQLLLNEIETEIRQELLNI